MNTIIEFLQSIVSLNEVLIVLAMIFGQIFTGTLAALIRGDFELQKFLDFHKKLAVYFSMYLGAGILGSVLTDWSALQAVVFGSMSALIADKILKNLSDAGIPVPNGLGPIFNNTVGLLPGVRILARRAEAAKRAKGE